MHSELTAVLEAERTYVCFEGGMVRGRDERTCSHINMQYTILRKGCMLGELGGGGSGRKIKRETEGERRGVRERLRKREEHAVTYVQCAVNILS